MRLIAILLLTGFLALLSFSGAAMAHGAMQDAAMSDHMAGCPDCPDLGAGEANTQCPHMSGCSALVLTVFPAVSPVVHYERVRHPLPVSHLLVGAETLIDLPPPRLSA